MTDEQKNEEAHGLWELAIARLAAVAQAGAKKKHIRRAVKAERAAYKHWRKVLERVSR